MQVNSSVVNNIVTINDLLRMPSEDYPRELNRMADAITDQLRNRSTDNLGESQLCIQRLEDILDHSIPDYDPSDRPLHVFFRCDKPTKISLLTVWAAGGAYYGYVGMDDSGNIAHYGKDFDNGQRKGH